MAHEKLQETHVGPFPPLIPFFLDFDSQYSTIFDWKPPSERIPIHDFSKIRSNDVKCLSLGDRSPSQPCKKSASGPTKPLKVSTFCRPSFCRWNTKKEQSVHFLKQNWIIVFFGGHVFVHLMILQNSIDTCCK